MLIISVSGLRGIVGESLNPEVATRYAAAFAEQLGAGPVVVARDSRSSGPMMSAAIEAALCGMGRQVLRAGIAATPTVGVLVRACQAAGAMQISASHNPIGYNGIKLFGPDGRVLSATAGARVAERYRQQQAFQWRGTAELGQAIPLSDTTSAHLSLVLSTVNVPRIRQRAFRVVLDANHGAGGILGWQLLEELGCRITLLGGEPDGQFAHPPEPIAENLTDVGRIVVAQEADICFCQDPDADRLAVIDEHGSYLGEEYTLALCARHRLTQQIGPVVTNCATSRMTQDIAAQSGASFFRSAVGEANVADMMIANRAIFGGEGNGGPIDPRVGHVRDSFVGMALILDALAERNVAISTLAGELPRYVIHKSKLDMAPQDAAAAIERVQRHFHRARPDRLDGLRLDWTDRWLLIRGSNTEPIVRIIAEAPTSEDAQALCREAAEVMGR